MAVPPVLEARCVAAVRPPRRASLCHGPRAWERGPDPPARREDTGASWGREPCTWFHVSAWRAPLCSLRPCARRPGRNFRGPTPRAMQPRPARSRAREGLRGRLRSRALSAHPGPGDRGARLVLAVPAGRPSGRADTSGGRLAAAGCAIMARAITSTARQPLDHPPDQEDHMGKKLLFVGAGAIGSYLGSFLARAGHDVTIIDGWAEQVETIRRDGISVTGPH